MLCTYWAFDTPLGRIFEKDGKKEYHAEQMRTYMGLFTSVLIALLQPVHQPDPRRNRNLLLPHSAQT